MIKKLKNKIYYLACVPLILLTHTSYAELPPAPPELAGQKGDWLGNLLVWGESAGRIFLIALGAAVLSIISWSIVQAFAKAQENESWGKFGVTLVSGIVCATVAFFLIKYGWSDLSTTIN